MRTFIITCLAVLLAIPSSAEDLKLKITKRYLNIPVSHKEERASMSFQIKNKKEREFVIRLAPENPDYWVFCDMSHLQGKEINITYAGNNTGLKQIYQSEQIAGQDSLYKEKNRPQLHFSTRRGWINDPNGLVFHNGEYHLYYQHNPYEKEWGNMHWGHAVSKDLIHWAELPVALYPDEHGTMFSGSAIIDYDNTLGVSKKGLPTMVIAYTADSPAKQVQCIAYSLDNGRTFTKIAENPVIDSKHIWNSQDTRDPKLFKYQPTGDWTIVLNERDGHSIYTSRDLKNWTYQSHITGFWECPELFELPVDGDPKNTKWVMYGATGTYMLGSFDGKKFTPESGKHYYTTGSLYAAQTFANIPDSDGRRIQVAWSRLSHPGMPFNGQMLIPTELCLRKTKNGIRLFSVPVKEFDTLQTKAGEWSSLSSDKANEVIKAFNNSEILRIKATIKLSHATSAGLSRNGQALLDYDMNGNLVNGVFYSPEDMTSMEITADLIIDKTSVEGFIDNGAYSYSISLNAKNDEGFRFWGNNIEIKNLEIHTLKSIWK
ncbi:glycoside hydrolase family 32 protein [Massilibacteroides vaginae]|uniref:glycoside hydrolase family 32 protein n=1 Tax=Massilibacteroides vaginae TaxID=1673718 RepID=UPI000A1CCEC7|nr:glycoside hydrolase family 32 protein [Massilibacteroides vaginae]